MKLHILADLHNEFGRFVPPEADADLVILAGDTDLGTKGIEWAKEAFAGKPVLLVPGNHEYYGSVFQSLQQKMQEAAAGSNVHLLGCDKYEQDGIVFLGATLWTDFKLLGDQRIAMLTAKDGMNDFKKIRMLPSYRPLSPAATVSWHTRAMGWLKKELQAATGKKIVVITHHLPSLKSVPERYRTDPISAAFASNLDEFVATSGAVLWVHGHTHEPCDYVLGETRVLCNPRGYDGRETTGYAPALVVEV
ncbi:metallophosphoesterase [Thiovibrio sp. JS02]